MNRSQFRVLFLLGIVIGAAGIVVAVQFAPGDAGHVSDGVAFGAPNGMNVTLYGSGNVSMDDVFPNSSTHSSQFANRAVILNTTDGNITIAASNPAWASVHMSNLTGTWTNVTEITAGATWIEIYPQNKQRVDVRGDLNQISIKSMALDDGSSDFYIAGTDGGTGTVTIYDLPTNTQITAVGKGGTFLDTNTSDSNGNLTLQIPLSSHTVSLKDSSDNSPPEQSNPFPANNTIVSDTPDKLSIDINDSDFADNGDNVTVEFYLDGSKIATKFTEQNGTVTTTNVPSTLDLGEHTWAVNATDEYGNVVNTTYHFSLPQNITLRNETNASQVITGKNITATFYGVDGEVVVQRSDDNQDGNISLRNLPDKSFVVTFEGNGWYDRRAYIESIGNQQNIYLLNSTAYPRDNNSAIFTTFVYEDRTGEFPQDSTTLQVQRAVDPDDDGNFTWQTVAGDYWGAAGEFPFTGQYQTRYRLRIENQQTGESRILGTHIPVADGVKNIIVGQIIFEAENATGRFWDAGINKNTTNLQAYYQDPTNNTHDLTIKVWERGNKSNELYNQTFDGPVGEKLVIINLNKSQSKQNYVVTFEGQHSNDGRVFGRVLVGGGGYPLPIDPLILYAFSYIGITFGMALYGPRTALLGAWMGVMGAAGLMFFGWTNIPVASIVASTVIAAGGTIYREAMPG